MKIEYVRDNCYKYTFRAKKVREWLLHRLSGDVLNLFAGPTELGVQEVRVDLDPELQNLDFCGSAEEFLDQNTKRFDVLIWDPPWNERKAREFYGGRYIGRFTRLKDKAVEAVKDGGILISAGYEITNFGKKRGTMLTEVLVVDPCGDVKPYFLSVERKGGGDG